MRFHSHVGGFKMAESQEQQEEAYKAIETAKATGKIAKGVNEVTKAMERGRAKLVAYAENVDPKELVMHIPVLAKDKGILCIGVDKKEELGAAAGLQRPTTCVAITKEGEAKKYLRNLTASKVPVKKEEPKEEKKEETKEEVKTEEPKEEKKEETKEEVKTEEPKEEKKEEPVKKEEKKEVQKPEDTKEEPKEKKKEAEKPEETEEKPVEA